MRKSAVIAYELARAYLAVRHERSVLGPLWYAMGPIAMLVAVGIFHRSSGLSQTTTLGAVAVGLLCFSYFRSMTSNVAGAPRASAGLLRSISLPVDAVFAARAIESTAIHLIELVIALVVVGWTDGLSLGAVWYVLPLASGALLASSVGVIVGVVSSFADDVRNAWTYALTVLMFASPVFIAAQVGERSWVMELNPVTHVVDAARAALVRGELDVRANALAAACALAAAAVAYLVYRRASPTLIERL